jgi:hypothetical protein
MKRTAIAILLCLMAHTNVEAVKEIMLTAPQPHLVSETEYFQDFSFDMSTENMCICSFSELSTDTALFEDSLADLSNVDFETEYITDPTIDQYFSKTRIIHENEALHYAVYANNIDLLQKLLSQNAETKNIFYKLNAINAPGPLGLTPLDIAISKENIEAAAILAKEGAYVSYGNLESSLDKPELLKALLPCKDSLRNIWNGTKILADYEFLYFKEEIVSFLIDLGADVDAQDEYGDSFFTNFSRYYRGTNEDFIDKVINASKNHSIRDSEGNTALENAEDNNPLIAKKLTSVGIGI